MHPRLQELRDHLETSRAELIAAVRSVPESRRDRPPSEGRWSVAGILEHLGLVEQRITNMLREEIGVLRSSGDQADSETSSVLAQTDLDRMMDRSAPIAAQSSGHPVRGLGWAEARAGLDETRGRLIEVVAGAEGLDLSARSSPHRVFGDLTLYQWIALVGAHERRHAAQIREIAATADSGD